MSFGSDVRRALLSAELDSLLPLSPLFVTRQGQNIMRYGVQIRPGAGVNAPRLLGINGQTPTGSDLDTMLAGMRGRIIRTFAYRTTSPTTMLSTIDAVLDKVEAAGAMLFMTLCDDANVSANPAGLGACGPRYYAYNGGSPYGNSSNAETGWYAGGTDPNGQSRWDGDYASWIQQVGAHCKNRTCIFAWELISEPQGYASLGDITTPGSYGKFVHDATALLKAADPNHLVFSGVWREYPEGKAAYQTALTNSGTDGVTLHTYDGNGNGYHGALTSQGEASPHCAPVAQIAASLNVPWIIGEFGIALGAVDYGQNDDPSDGSATAVTDNSVGTDSNNLTGAGLISSKLGSWSALSAPNTSPAVTNAAAALYWRYDLGYTSAENINATDTPYSWATINNNTAWPIV